ncbi:S24 family peptidase [Bacillus sp. JCM 19041]|uniref:LexA family protein n=1 Tax=Bacillus sp. JCM 19041 TaxID=1460637 RepID=UPI0006D10CD7
MDQKEFGEYLKEVRKNKGFTIRQLELKSGVSNSYLSLLENGKRGTPGTDILKKLSAILDIPYTEMLKKAGHLDESVVSEPQNHYMDMEQHISEKEHTHVTIPILSKIPSDSEVFAKENITDYMEIPKGFFGAEKGDFLIKVLDDSMKEAHIKSGDMVLVRSQNDVDTGDIAVVNIADNDADVRHIRKSGNDQMWLFPKNDDFDPTLVDNNDARILGKVIKVFTNP